MEICSWTQVHGPQVKLLRQLRKIEYTLIYKHHLAKMEEKREKFIEAFQRGFNIFQSEGVLLYGFFRIFYCLLNLYLLLSFYTVIKHIIFIHCIIITSSTLLRNRIVYIVHYL